ncbi:hypothetical protein [Emcibacter sp.]|nr:hypothetical protein [Emcibacter sp.]
MFLAERAKLHGGDLLLESELGLGTCVTVKLPVNANFGEARVMAG